MNEEVRQSEKKLIKYNGNGTVQVKTWFAIFSALVFIISTAISVYSFTLYDPLKCDVEETKELATENRHRLDVVERKEAARDERDIWIQATLEDVSKKINILLEKAR